MQRHQPGYIFTRDLNNPKTAQKLIRKIDAKSDVIDESVIPGHNKELGDYTILFVRSLGITPIPPILRVLTISLSLGSTEISDLT